MPRAIKLVPAAARPRAEVIDTLILPYAQRAAQRGFVFGVKGTCIELDLAEPALMRTDDALQLDDGRFVEVVAEAEPLIEVRLSDPAALARLAWQLGGRHVPVEARARSLRLCRDKSIETWLAESGIKFITIEAPFDPDTGFPASSPDHHHHHNHHEDHDHHTHAHAQGSHGHDKSRV
jgi:urease accessory protein